MKRQQESVKQQILDSASSARDTSQSLHSCIQQSQNQSQMHDERYYDGPQYLWKYQLLLQSRRNGTDLGDGLQSFTTQIQVSSEIEQLKDEIECHRKEKEELQRQLEKVQKNYKQILIHSTSRIQNKVDIKPKKLKIERATSELFIFENDLNEEVELKRQLSKQSEEISIILSEKQIQHDLLISRHQQQEYEFAAFKKQHKAIQNRLDEVERLTKTKEREIQNFKDVVQSKNQQISVLTTQQQTVQLLQIQLQSTNEQLKQYRDKHFQLNTKYQCKKKQCNQLAKELQTAKNKEDMTKINNELNDAKKQNSQLELALRRKQQQIKLLQKDILRIKQQLSQAQKQFADLQNDLKNSQDANFTMKRDLKFAQQKAKCKEDQLRNYKAKDQSNETVNRKNANLQQALRECQNKLKSTEQVAKINKGLQEDLRKYSDKIKFMEQESVEYIKTIQKSQQQKSQLLQQLMAAQSLQESTIQERKSSSIRTNQVISQKKQMENQIIEQKKKHNQLETTLMNEKKKIAQYQDKINDQVRINNESLKKINSLEVILKSKDTDLSKQEAVIKAQAKTIEESSSNIKRIQANIKDKSCQLQKSNKKITSLEANLNNKETQLSQKLEIIKTQSNALEVLQIKSKKLQANLKAKQSEHQKQSQAKQRQIQAKQKMIAALKQQNETMKVADKKNKDQLKKIENQLIRLKKQKQNCEQYINRIEQESATLDKQKKNIQANLEKLTVKFDNLSAKLQQSLDFIKTVEKQVLCQQIINTENITDKDIELVIEKLNKLKYFPDSQILSNSPLPKHRFLCQNLKRFLQIQTFQTKLIYKYPTLDTTNFHTYFDNKRDLVIMVKLANGTIIGGFTATPFLAERVPNGNRGQGFLFSLTAEKTFKMRIDPRQSITTYDHFFLILGNAEIRLRAGEKKVFSNFGIATSTFDNVGYPRTSFLGVQDQTNNQLDIESYEIFQIIMDRDRR